MQIIARRYGHSSFQQLNPVVMAPGFRRDDARRELCAQSQSHHPEERRLRRVSKDARPGWWPSTLRDALRAPQGDGTKGNCDEVRSLRRPLAQPLRIDVDDQ